MNYLADMIFFLNPIRTYASWPKCNHLLGSSHSSAYP